MNAKALKNRKARPVTRKEFDAYKSADEKQDAREDRKITKQMLAKALAKRRKQK